jgi:sugar O-acyltransferase (sialic acid O-acetyltransferase NeuD family)
MILAGAGGHAREILDLLDEVDVKKIFLFDDYSQSGIKNIFRFPVLTSKDDLKDALVLDSNFILATGSPRVRRKMFDQFVAMGGICTSIIAKSAQISKHNVCLGQGINVMSFALVSNSVKINNGCLINARVHIHHDVSIGDFCEIGPASILLGNVSVGSNTKIGAGSVILPNVSIGEDCIIAAGSVVTKNLTSGSKVKGPSAQLF